MGPFREVTTDFAYLSTMPFRVAILTVSDTTYNKGSEYDLSGPLLKQKVEQNHEYALADSAIVPDDIDSIRAKVKEWVGQKGKDKVDWVITTGGECSGCGVNIYVS